MCQFFDEIHQKSRYLSICLYAGPLWPSNKASALRRSAPTEWFETRFHRRSAVYASPLNMKSYVVAKCLPAGVVRKLGEGGASSRVVLVI
ncbi:hypothetical protein AVEN_116291-1 [Araneus ventricosus]|uniref:Uncharacterized protein n=1 Tax=Araneus ventricosus TaxID=182803 RepID=A0A4Y2FQU4_ARAVE|nr:hypothetical protein AVEN_116291-1 [Araneus ventricosus]